MKLFPLIVALLSLSSVLASASELDALEKALSNPERPQEDKDRDRSRRAPEVLDFLGLESGMTVLDISAGAGWYTEVLSYAVGSSGKVYMQNPYGSPDAEVNEARADRLGNVETWLVPIFALPGNSIDFAITGLNLHDAYNADPAFVQSLLGEIKAALKPGGILGVIDHKGTVGKDNAALHRVTFESAVSALVQGGFALVQVSDLLSNPQDDHSLRVDDPALGRNTDRFLLKLINL